MRRFGEGEELFVLFEVPLERDDKGEESMQTRRAQSKAGSRSRFWWGSWYKHLSEREG